MIDVNTGRFVGSRSKSSGARLEDTITKNNLEAVKEVVRQLRLRDIGGIIVIDFIDMANPKNRATVEGALRTELERDRTKTYVVEISPLGLVEMTRQNVTDGPREIMTKKCPTCGGDGIVLSETSAAVEISAACARSPARHGTRPIEWKSRQRSPRSSSGRGPRACSSWRNRRVDASTCSRSRTRTRSLPRARRRQARGACTGGAARRRGQDRAEARRGRATRRQRRCRQARRTRHRVANAAKQVGKKVEVQIERVLDDAAYATLVSQAVAPDEPITAESEAEKPTRRSASAMAATPAKTAELDDPELDDEDEEDEAEADDLETDEPEADERKRRP